MLPQFCITSWLFWVCALIDAGVWPASSLLNPEASRSCASSCNRIIPWAAADPPVIHDGTPYPTVVLGPVLKNAPFVLTVMSVPTGRFVPWTPATALIELSL